MAIPYVCILIAALLPYVWTVVAKRNGQHYDNRNPRAWLGRQDNPRVHRANSAQLNAFEAFPAFAAAVLMAQWAGVDPQRITWLAVGFVAMRVLHGVLYVADQALGRSLVWLGGFMCMVALMGLAITAL